MHELCDLYPISIYWPKLTECGSTNIPHLQLPSSLWANSSFALHIQHFFLFFCWGLSSGKKGSTGSLFSLFFSPSVWPLSVSGSSVFSSLEISLEELLVLTDGMSPNCCNRAVFWVELLFLPLSAFDVLPFCVYSVKQEKWHKEREYIPRLPKVFILFLTISKWEPILSMDHVISLIAKTQETNQ